ncbi:MAG TPA: GSCFA domain-containing protein [Rhizomicrobium sp.]|nr:GSCFA domain-containing protein [Rhizomicrobium sp.]
MPKPLVSIPAAQAIQNRKGNKAATWGERGLPNRVEPIAKPLFDVPFLLQPGQRIFTVGSCFARNVEVEFQNRGFQIPARDLFKLPEFLGQDLGLLNNYGTPSIYNEIAWAFGKKKYSEDDNILEISPGKFVDIHVVPSRRPEPKDIVLARRRAITAVYREAATCDVCIMTLGLAETWFDKKTGLYLNVSPRPSMISAEPDRFELHVLSYADAYKFLSDAITILHRAAPAMRILLTVSPVPLTNTHRQMDVIVANGYSKAVLRAAAEEAIVRHDFVSYFPSFESFTISDRKLAWLDDLVHTNEALVAFNVQRMITAFTNGELVDDATVLEQAALMAETSPAEALSLLKEDNSTAALVIKGTALIAAGCARDAYDMLDPVCQPKFRSRQAWHVFIKAAIAMDDLPLAVSAYERMKSVVRRLANNTTGPLASWFHKNGRDDIAAELRAPAES